MTKGHAAHAFGFIQGINFSEERGGAGIGRREEKEEEKGEVAGCDNSPIHVFWRCQPRLPEANIILFILLPLISVCLKFILLFGCETTESWVKKIYLQHLQDRLAVRGITSPKRQHK